MHYLKQHRWAQAVAIVVLALVGLAIGQVVTLQHAHRSFDNYASFRGCQQITSRSVTSGTCRLANGQSITIVQDHGRWYLQGDLGFP